ncbi:hypothetical protein [Streptomyces sp. SGAir0957]
MSSKRPDHLVNAAAATRLGTLLHLRGPEGRTVVAQNMAHGSSYTMPADWRRLPASEQARALVNAEARRIADARVYAFDETAVSALRAVADDLDVLMPVSADLVPSPSGMIFFASPVSVSADEGIITAATWGPPMDGFGDGVHLTWWTDTLAFTKRELAAGRVSPGDAEYRKRFFGPLMLHVDMHLPFVPLVDIRLVPLAELQGPDRDSAPAIRAIIAAWYALKHGLVPVREERADPDLGRALAEEKAKHRGVQVARAEDAQDLAAAVREQAHLAAQKLPQQAMGGLSNPDQVLPCELDEAFLPGRDEELDPGLRWATRLYRDAAQPLAILEEEAQQRYPGIFDHLEEVRAREYGNWPKWCWVPYSRVARALADLGSVKDVDLALQHAVVIAGLGAWKACGRNAVVLDWLPDPGDRTDLVPADIPAELPFHGAALLHTDVKDGVPVYSGGMLAFLDYNTNEQRAELLCLDHNGGPGMKDVYEWQLLLSGSTVPEAAEATAAVSLLPAKPSGEQTTREELTELITGVFGRYFPFLATLADPTGNNAVVGEVAAALGRRPPQAWPPAGGGRHMTLWLTRPAPTH